MKYIIMCGANEPNINDVPRQLCEVNGERVVERTIRILKELGIDDIAITSTLSDFSDLGVEYLNYDSSGIWINCFYQTDYPVCYLYGDVYYSYTALYTIVNTDVEDIEFFASTDTSKFSKFYTKQWAEPFAFKVANTERFGRCIKQVRKLYNDKNIQRCISWELWQVIKGSTLNIINYSNYVAINDYTCDIDDDDDLHNMNSMLCSQPIMIHATNKRLWYVYSYLIPSLERQGVSNITVWVDKEHKGNLQSCIDSFSTLPYDGHTWHLQDDIVISNNFRWHIEYSTAYKIVCGFASKYDKTEVGIVTPDKLWYSFPCIRIDNSLAHEFVDWLNDNLSRFEYCVNEKKYDDTLFKDHFLAEEHNNLVGINYYPNIVNHIDYLIGGSISNTQRVEDKIEALYWSVNDKNIIPELERSLKYANRQY